MESNNKEQVADACKLDYVVHFYSHDFSEDDFTIRFDENNEFEDKKVCHPNHYNQGGIEVLDIIKAFYGDESYENFCMGNVVKYILRCRHKGNLSEDLKKAKFYLDEVIKLRD